MILLFSGYWLLSPVYSIYEPDVSIRSLSMGGCCVAITDPTEPAVANPASLSKIEMSSFTSLQVKLPTDTELFYMSYCGPLFGGAIGISWIQSGLSDIMQTGSIDDEPEVIGSFCYSSNDYAVSFGKALLENLSAGLSLKYSTSDLPGLEGPDGSSYGYSASAGLLFSPNDSISFGLKVDNLFNSRYWSTNNIEHEPVIIRIGGSSYFPFFGSKLLMAEDVSRSLEPDGQMRVCFGAELPIGNALFRVGCGDSFSAGFGVTKGNIELNYAYVDRQILSSENVHRVSLTYYW